MSREDKTISLTKNIKFKPSKLNLKSHLQDSMSVVNCDKNMLQTDESSQYIDVVMRDMNKIDDIQNIKGKIPNNIDLYSIKDKCTEEDAPSRHRVMKNSTFGKTSKNHSFKTKAYFEYTLIFILKCSFLSQLD